MPRTSPVLRNFVFRLLAMLALACSSAGAQTGDPPGRVATLTAVEGMTLFARAGEAGWTEAVRNRPITIGDRLRTEDGRAELHLGTAALHLDSRTVVEIAALDLQAAQLAVTEGSVNARVRGLAAGEYFEIGTPQLAVRAFEPGEWRIDVDKAGGFTRVTVRGGAVMVHGENGAAMRLDPGQQMVFAGRELMPLAGVPAPFSDSFDLWTAERNRAQDASTAARHLPREVVGYPALDSYGTWSSDPAYGTVWYPRLATTAWVPYRYGRWEWIAPWGWTWIDDAPWGFAPFHYGRWAIIGSRWAWVPGPLGPRPMYAPALVGFVGGEGWSFALGSGPGIGWYPLAPGEVWQPFYRTSPAYVSNVNRYVVPAQRHYDREHVFHRRPDAITALRANDFQRGVPVGRRWVPVHPTDVARAQPHTPPAPSPQARPGNDRVRPGLRLVQPPVQFDSSPREKQKQPVPAMQPRSQQQPTQPHVRPDRPDGEDHGRQKTKEPPVGGSGQFDSYPREKQKQPAPAIQPRSQQQLTQPHERSDRRRDEGGHGKQNTKEPPVGGSLWRKGWRD